MTDSPALNRRRMLSSGASAVALAAVALAAPAAAEQEEASQTLDELVDQFLENARRIDPTIKTIWATKDMAGRNPAKGEICSLHIVREGDATDVQSKVKVDWDVLSAETQSFIILDYWRALSPEQKRLAADDLEAKMPDLAGKIRRLI